MEKVQTSILYHIPIKSGTRFMTLKVSKIQVDDLYLKRQIEDAILQTGLDIAEEPTGYRILRAEKRLVMIFYVGEKIITKIREVSGQTTINMLKFFSPNQKISIRENYDNKVKVSGFDIGNVIYFMKGYQIKKLESVNQVIALITISKFKKYDRDIQTKTYNSMLELLNEGQVSENFFDFSETLRKNDIFICKANAFLDTYKKMHKEFSQSPVS